MSAALTYHDKDLSQLPAPDVVDLLDYESLLEERKSAYNGLQPLLIQDGQPVLLEATLVQTDTETYWKVPVDENAGLYYVDLDSDPATRLLQADVYRELLFRNRVNKAAQATMIAYAVGADLDHLAATSGLHRLVVSVATDTTDAVMESDTALRRRVQYVLEGYARGGSQGWYLLNALSASGLVKDAFVYSPAPCEIEITILSYEGDGTASAELLATVRDYINQRYSRVLGDLVTVKSAEIIHYSLSAELFFYEGAGASVVVSEIVAAWSEYRAAHERVGVSVAESAVFAQLHQAGVYRVLINTPSLPVQVSSTQAAYCESVTLYDGSDQSAQRLPLLELTS